VQHPKLFDTKLGEATDKQVLDKLKDLTPVKPTPNFTSNFSPAKKSRAQASTMLSSYGQTALGGSTRSVMD